MHIHLDKSLFFFFFPPRRTKCPWRKPSRLWSQRGMSCPLRCRHWCRVRQILSTAGRRLNPRSRSCSSNIQRVSARGWSWLKNWQKCRYNPSEHCDCVYRWRLQLLRLMITAVCLCSSSHFWSVEFVRIAVKAYCDQVTELFRGWIVLLFSTGWTGQRKQPSDWCGGQVYQGSKRLLCRGIPAAGCSGTPTEASVWVELRLPWSIFGGVAGWSIIDSLEFYVSIHQSSIRGEKCKKKLWKKSL